MYPSYSYHHSPQGVMNLSSLHATFLPKESGPGFVNDYIPKPSTGKAKRSISAKPSYPFVQVLDAFLSILEVLRVKEIKEPKKIRKKGANYCFVHKQKSPCKAIQGTKILKPMPDVPRG